MKRFIALAIGLTITVGTGRAAEPPPPPLVWVLDGAGDYHGCSKALTYANTQAGNPVEVAVFPWSHGHRSLYLDQVDLKYARLQGARLAEKIRERSKQAPGRRVVVLAHSAGSAVALAAAECLPRDTIDRMILLAPSVSSCYDVRPSLPAIREGIDAFCSKKDWVALGVATRLVGTVDKRWAPAAGRKGFRSAAEPSKFRQTFWTHDLAWTGHTGGHYGVYAPAFLQAYIFPLVGVSAH
jgi:hypothetical protein